MAEFRKILRGLTRRLGGKRGVTSAEYAILAVGVVIVVGGAIRAFSLDNPMIYASSALTSGQASLATTGR
jgi:hypothetical protein